MSPSNTGASRTILRLSAMLVAVGTVAAFGVGGCDSGGVGDPCTPEEEFLGNFPGFSIKDTLIESRSFQCQTRVCLINHFQGRVSCPNGQAAPVGCTADGTTCPAGESCVSGGQIIQGCDPTPCGEEGADKNNCNDGNKKNAACGGATCDPAGRFCHCSEDQCPTDYVCDGDSNLCTTKVCAPNDASADRCYVPGTSDPIAVSVCSQCSKRKAEDSVYCSCRCGPPSDNPPEGDENFNFCECPEGFVCEEVRRNLGISDPQLTGKFCVKQNTTYKDESQCGTVLGAYGAGCAGSPAASN